MSERSEEATAAERAAATYRHARREAVLIMLVWAVALIYTVAYCAHYGYQDGSGPLQMVWGVPRWVFWGIVAPWVAAVIFTIWFCFGFMADDDLGADQETHIAHGEGRLDAR